MDSHFKENFRKKYKTIKKIGFGNFTEVYQVENIKTKELRAIKIIKLDDIKLHIKMNL